MSDTIKKQRSKHVISYLTSLWIMVLAAVFAWQALQYRGIVSRLAEWQYYRFDYYYPGITFFLLCLIFSLPLFLIRLLLRRQRSADEQPLSDVETGTLLLGKLRRQQYILSGAAVISGVIAVAVFIASLFLPGNEPNVQRIEAARQGQGGIAEGRTELVGYADMQSVVRFDMWALLAWQREYIAPVRAYAGDKGPARFFVHVRGTGNPQSPFEPIMSGVLKKDALPGDVYILYQQNMQPGTKNTWLLYKDRDQLSWRHRMVAAQMAILAAISGIVAWLIKRRRKRLSVALREAPLAVQDAPLAG